MKQNIMMDSYVLERNESIIKPDYDDRFYRGLTLANKLKVILVSDPKTDKSAASLSVHIGALLDPWPFQGLAHLVEHALFIGSKKYPEDNSFKDFIVQHGGRTNGNTNHTETIYYFDVDTDSLAEGLDQFAQFFIEPLFLDDKIERELDSVQLEFDNTRTQDLFRMARVRKAVADPGHDFAKFEFGNKATLDPKDGRLYTELLKFYHEHYSANLMALVVLGKETLDELEKMVAPLFAQIVNRDLSPYCNDQHPFPPEYCRKEVCMTPLKIMSRMSLFFPMPDPKHDLAKHDALNYLTFLLAHEGPGGLLARLKELGLANTVIVQAAHLAGFSFLIMNLDLTKGVRAHAEILRTIFEYILMLKSVAPSERIFNEIKKINSVLFNYRDKLDPIVCVRYISSHLLKWPLEQALCSRELMFGEFNAAIINEMLAYLSVDTLNMHVMSTAYKNMALTFQTEPYYGTQYAVKDIDPAVIEACRNVQLNPAFHLPEPNPFIPEVFDLKKGDAKEAQHSLPRLIVKEKHMKIWHLLDDKYKIPKAFYGFQFKCPLVNNSPLNCNLMSLLSFLFHDHVNQKFYSADLVGIYYYVSASKIGLEVGVRGFNDKLIDFIKALIDELLNYKVNPKRYQIFEDICYNTIDNFPTRPLLSQAVVFRTNLLAQTSWTMDELKGAMREVSLDKVEALTRQILSHFELEAFVHGNVTAQEACTVTRMVCDRLTKATKYFPIDSFIGCDVHREIRLPDQTIHEYRVDNSIHENNALLVYFQVGHENLELLAQMHLFHQVINEPYFNQIRMKEQLAYLTFVYVRHGFSGLLGFNIEIQSGYDLDYLERRIQAFVDSMEDYIANLSGAIFSKERASLITRLAEKPKALFTYSTMLWSEIISSEYLFDRNDRLIAYLRSIDDQSAILNLYKTYIAQAGPKCRQLIVRIKATKSPHLKGKEDDQACPPTSAMKRIPIEHIRKFKCSQDYYSLAPMLTEHL